MNRRILESRSLRRLAVIATACAIVGLSTVPVFAATYYWNTTTTGLWTTGANWSNAISGGTTGVAPAAADTVVFNQSAINGSETIQLGVPTTIAGMTFANTGATTITANASGSQALSIGASGIVVNAGAGAVTIGNASNAVPITMTAAQSWTNNSTSGLTIVNNVTNGGFLLTVAGSSSTVSIGGAISGSGGLATSSTGTLILTGQNLYTGTTTISGGALSIGNGGTTGSIANASNVVNGSALVFNRSDAIAYSGTISGAGVLAMRGGGTLTLTGSNLFTGNTFVQNGSLVLTGGTNRLQTGAGLVLGGEATLGKLVLGDGTGASSQTFGFISTSGSGGSIVGGNAATSTLTVNMGIGTNVTFAGVLGGSNANENNLAFTKSGSGTLWLTNANTYSGTTNINGGMLSLGNALALGTTSTIMFTGGTMQFSAANTVDYSSRFASSTSPIALDTNGQSAVFATGLATTNAGLTKSGLGMLTLTAQNLNVGVTTVAGGTLALDFSGVSAPTINILKPTASTTLSGGSLLLVGKANTTISQTTTGLTLGYGASSITLSADATANPLLLNIAAITASTNATLDITNPTGTISATNGVVASNSNVNGIIHGSVTVGGVDWAVSGTTTGIRPLAAYTADTWASGSNTTVTTSSAIASGTTNSLRMNAAVPATLTLSGTSGIGSGGILVTANVGNNLSQINGGTLLTNNSPGVLYVIQNNTANSLSIGSVLAGTGGLTKSGAGNLLLSGNNRYTGNTSVLSGTLALSGTNYGNATSVKSGATYRMEGQISTSGTSLAANMPYFSSSIANDGSVVFASSVSQAWAGMTGSGSLTLASTGMLEFVSPSSYTGDTNILSGTLVLGSGGPGNTSSSAFLGSGNYAGNIVNNGTLVYNGADSSAIGQILRGVISGTGLIVKTGPWNNQSTWSALTLSGSNTFTGQVSVQAGNLNIDFSMVGAPTSAILPAAASIAMGKPSSGTPAVSRFGNNDGYLTVPTFKTYLNVIGSPNVVNNQTLAGLVVDSGIAYVTAKAALGNTLNFNVGDIQRSADSSGVAYLTPVNSVSGTAQFLTTSPNVNGIVNGWTVMPSNGAMQWVTSAGSSGSPGLLTPLSTYATNVFGSGSNTNVTSNTTLPGIVETNSLRLGAASTLTLSGTLTVTSGGILNAGNYNATIAGGVIRGPAGGELRYIGTGQAYGYTAINSVIADNGSATAFSVMVPSGNNNYGIAMGGMNTYTGKTTLGYAVYANSINTGTSGPFGNGGPIEFTSGWRGESGGTLGYNTSAAGLAKLNVSQNDYSTRFTNSPNQTYAVNVGAGARITWSGSFGSPTASLIVTSAGDLLLTGSNTFPQGVLMNMGGGGPIGGYASGRNFMSSITLGSANAIGTTGFVSIESTGIALAAFGKSKLRYTAASAGLDLGSRITGYLNCTINVDTNGQSVNWASPMSINGTRFYKLGFGTLTLSGSSGGVAGLMMAGGTLVLDSGTVSQVINPTAYLTGEGVGTIRFRGAAGIVRSQTFSAINASGGLLTLEVDNVGTSTTLATGTVARSAGHLGDLSVIDSGLGTIDFRAVSGTFGTTAIVKTAATQPLVSGIMGPWATVGGTDWATQTSGTIQAYTAYTDIDARGATLADGPSTNVRLNAAGSGGAMGLAATTTTVSTLLQSSATPATINTAGKTLATTGIMIGQGAAALTVGTAPNSGTLTPASAGGELVVSNFSNSTLTMNSAIADNTSVSSVTFSGSGVVVLTASNTFSGGVRVNGGTLQIGDGGTAGQLALGTQTAGRMTTGTGQIWMSPGATIVFNRTDAYGGIFTHPIQGSAAGDDYAGGLRMLGGDLVMYGWRIEGSNFINNSYSGFTQLIGGRITASEQALSGYGDVTFLGGVLRLGKTGFAVTDDYSRRIAGSTSPIRFDTNGSASTFNFPLAASNVAGLVKQGQGALTLNQCNLYDGSTVVQGGSLIADATNFYLDSQAVFKPSSNLVGEGTGTFQYKGSATFPVRSQTMAGLTLSAGLLTVDVNNPGTSTTLDLSGTSGSLGITRTTGAVNFIASAGTFATNAIVKVSPSTVLSNDILGPWATVAGGNWATVNSGTVVAYTGYTDINTQGSTIASNSAANVRLSAAGSGAAISLGSQSTAINTLLQNTTTAGTVSLSGQTLAVGGIMISAGNSALDIGQSVGAGTVTAATAGGQMIFANFSANTLTVNAAIANNTSASSLILNGTGAGRVVLAGPNSFSGATVLNSGTLQVNHAAALGGGGPIQFGGGWLQYSANNTVDYSSRISTVNAPIQIDTNGQNVVFASGLGAANQLGLTKIGSGTLVLSGSNDYWGQTTVSNGMLQFTNPNALYGGDMGKWNGVNLAVAAAGTLALNVGGIGEFTVAQWDQVRQLDFGSSWAGTQPSVSGASVGIDTTNAVGGNVTVSSTISNPYNSLQTPEPWAAFNIVKLGSGTLTLSAANTYVGTTSINGGSILLGNALSLGGTASNQIVINAGILDLGGLRVTKTGAITMGFGTIGNGTLSGSTATISLTGTGSSLISASLSGTNATLGLTKAGVGLIGLSGVNTYSGTTQVNAGVLSVASTTSLPGWNVNSRVAVAANAGLVVGNSVNDADFVTLAALVGSYAVNASIGFDTTTGDRTYSGVIANSSAGARGLWKVGPNTLTLSASSTYTGTTQIGNSNGVNGGTLRLGTVGAMAGTAVTVFGGTLDLNNLNQTVTAATALTLGGGAVGSSASVLTGSGTLSLNGNAEYVATNNPNGATISGRLDLVNATRTFTVGDSTATAYDLSIDAVISGTGAGALTKAGAGTLVLAGLNTFVGKTSIQYGTLQTASIANVGAASSPLGAPTTTANGTIDIGSTTTAGTLRYVGSGDTTNRVINMAGTTGGSTLDASGSGPLVFSSAMTATVAGIKTLTLTGSST
ncbi:MAG: hypothetical protein DWI23_01535, partial [Planctomycetota bacterium]